MFPADSCRINTANADFKCKSGEKYVTFDVACCLGCDELCLSHCPAGSSATDTNCDLIRLFALPRCECCCKAFPKPPPPPPSPPPPSPSPPPPSPPPPSPPPPHPHPLPPALKSVQLRSSSNCVLASHLASMCQLVRS
ncbi:hypothetical protein C5167_028682 [Papaver somniferum]|uniref:chitin-binding lectin 1-like n=1 Tax=Papaver somniferum TaxID=3469 RepID=UPI000E6FBA5A|nr:chitin-binding lectin 1-like [Papaver somniferum]RZC90850.1 hypothetical protein C5167_028682 [Papaver somniferum]